MKLELTYEEFQTLEDIFDDWGSDCPGTDCDKRQALGEKLGFLEHIPEPTPEQIKRREEFAEKMRPIMEASNHYLEKIAKSLMDTPDILYGVAKLPIGSILRIKIPNDYLVKD